MSFGRENGNLFGSIRFFGSCRKGFGPPSIQNVYSGPDE